MKKLFYPLQIEIIILMIFCITISPYAYSKSFPVVRVGDPEAISYESIKETSLEDSVVIKAVESELLKKASENIEKYRKGDAQIIFKNKSGKPVQNEEIKITQKTHNFLFGCIIFDLVNLWGDDSSSDTELYKTRFKGLFNNAVLPFYWASYERTPGMTRWEKLMPVVDWCNQNGITTKGHPLVWTNPSGVPAWLSDLPVTVSEELLKARIINTVKGYKGKIDMWDVVNEPSHTRTWNHVDMKFATKEPVPDAADNAEKAFRWAYLANPEGNLILNEFQQIMSPQIRKSFYDLVAELKKRNTPITGLGLQSHEPWDCWFPPKEVWDTYDYYAPFGYPLHITEYMPQSSGKEITGGWRKGTWTEEAQADFAEQFYRLSFGYPAIVSICWMGLSDKRIYLPGGGLLDVNYRPKPSYNRLDKLINEEWKTNLSIKTNNEGKVLFRGFYGKYDVAIKTEEGKLQTFEIHLIGNEENKWVFTIKD
jgi:GH35 family endo-1,4-beta-xylanase